MGMEISKNTKVTLSATTIGFILLISWQAFVFADQVSKNTTEIQKSKIRDVQQDIRYYRTEKKKVLLHEETSGITPLSTELKKDLEDDIRDLEKREECLTEGDKICDV